MNNEFSTISDVLNGGVFDKLKGARAFKYSAIFSFWPQIVGSKFKDCSKPYSLKGSKMYVTCQNSYVLQELSMYKKMLIEKLKVYCEPLEVKVEDIVFDYKNWQQDSVIESVDDFAKIYSDVELEKIEIDKSAYTEVFSNIDESPYLNEEQKQKFKDRIIKLERAKTLRSI